MILRRFAMIHLKVRYHEIIQRTVLTGELLGWYAPECDDICLDFQQMIDHIFGNSKR